MAAKPLYTNISSVVKSPCVSLCKLDEARYCQGCHRHVEHIREWRAASDERRREIVGLAEQRKARLAHEHG
ncbi:DUF1289 domain-containing protein [Pseudomonas massiliensis]|uniref:DUF1289 domain-containing protein n=1 Tax=Pseudomonas massiliensis TaxID=522492 RepID=UPI00058C9536|nr:DUF1289 domain-containing protein [Pseudomonas massiliensis]